MHDYDFELSFALPTHDGDVDDLVDLLYEAGCDDATPGVGLKGHVAMMFTRRAGSAQGAVLSAIADVRRALPDARLEEASPDLVGLSDLAELLAVSRQNARKLIVDAKKLAPSPVHLGTPTLWRLVDLLRWLRDEKAYRIDEQLVELAEVIHQVNLAVAGASADRDAQKQILALLR